MSDLEQRVARATHDALCGQVEVHEDWIAAYAEQIRQAEQAAYERAAQEVVRVSSHKYSYLEVAEAIRALAQEPEEVG